MFEYRIKEEKGQFYPQRRLRLPFCGWRHLWTSEDVPYSTNSLQEAREALQRVLNPDVTYHPVNQ